MGGTANTPTVVSATALDLSASAATGGTAPYTYQWHRSEATGFTPDGTTAIPGAASLAYSDAGLSYYTTYYYKLVATDSLGASFTYAEVSARTLNRFIYEVLNSAGIVERTATIDLDVQGLLPTPVTSILATLQSDQTIRIIISDGTGYKELVHRNEATGEEDVVSSFTASGTKIFNYAF